MNKKTKIFLFAGLVIVLAVITALGIILYRPVHICNKIIPYAQGNYCFAISMKLSSIRSSYKLKYSLLDKNNLEQIFFNLKDFRGNTDSDRIEEFTSPEIICNIEKRNEKIDKIVQEYIKFLEDSIEANKYHAKQLERRTNTLNIWENAMNNANLAYGETVTEQLEEDLKNAKEYGIFEADFARRQRQFRALGTPYCEIDSQGTITDCNGEYVGTVKNVFKPLGTKSGTPPTTGDDLIKIHRAIKAYEKDKAKEKANDMNISEDCAKKYNEAFIEEGIVDVETLNCSDFEKQAIKSYEEKLSKKAEKNSGYLDDEPVYSNAGMPKSLVLKDVSIMCFEKANLGDKSKCSTKELGTIEEFFNNNPDINWKDEHFEYPIF